MRQLSICRVTHALYPDVIGGHAIFCHELSARQANLGHRVQVFTARRDRLPRDEVTKVGYVVNRLDKVWMPWDSLGMSNPFMPSLYAAVNRPTWDLVDAHAHLFWATALSVKAALDSGKPVITTVHGLLAMRDWLATLSQRAYMLSVGTWALRNSSRVVCLTASDAREVAELGVSERKIREIPIAIDPDSFRPAVAKREGIVWAGRLVPEKGLKILLDAMTEVRRKLSLRLVIVGDGPMRNELIARTHSLGLSDLVTFRFEAERSEVAELLQKSQFFVLPSLKEGLPLTLLEAMASGSAIVASDLPQIRDVLGTAGFYFTPKDAHELARTILQAHSDDELRREKTRLARTRVEEVFSWSVVLPLLEDLYGELAAT